MERAPATSRNSLKEPNLKIKLSTCQFFKEDLHYLGHFTSEQGIQPLLETVTAAEKLKEASNIDKFHNFLGLAGYYRKFIMLFANITKPLNKLLQKSTKFQWSSQCQAKLHQESLYREPVL